MRWDHENRLSGVTIERQGGAEPASNGLINAEYVYDMQGERVVKKAPRLGATNQAAAEINLYAADFFTRRWSENTAAIRISAGGVSIGSVRLARTSQDTERYQYFYFSDLPNRSVTAVTKPTGLAEFTGEVIERLEYTPYGQIIKRNRPCLSA